jgi:dTDP-glucose 4,6-dehydratase
MSVDQSLQGRSVLITGGAGFLGSHFVRLAVRSGARSVINLDALTYAGDPSRLSDIEDVPDYHFVHCNIVDRDATVAVFAEHRPESVVHFAAESHVTRSESGPESFFETNVEGTRNVLHAARKTGVDRVIHISTDEVYGSLDEGTFNERDKQIGLNRAAPGYATSKSEADDLAMESSETLNISVARPTNAFGPGQFPEKAFPRWLTRALRGESIPIWGDGLYVRQWLYAEDLARAVGILLGKGKSGEAYNIGPNHDPEITNIDLANWIVKHYQLDDSVIEMTEYDRPNHDRRYSVDASKIRSLGWEPSDVWQRFAETADWYRANESWWRRHIDEAESIYHDVK